MIAYACGAMGRIPGVSELILRNAHPAFAPDVLSARSPVFLPGMLRLFDLPQLYRLLEKDYKVVLKNDSSAFCGKTMQKS